VEDQAKGLAEIWTEKWIHALEVRGKKPTQEGIKNYREAMERLALIKLEGGIKHE